MATMVVIVSTQPKRLAGVLIGGIAATVGLLLVWQRLEGLPSFMAGVLAFVVAALTIAYVLAASVEGTIDRRRRSLLGKRVMHDDVAVTGAHRCGHCRRPMVTVGGVAMCAYCDQ
ncbi:MAG: hypothetical protein ACR2N9_06940 [Acidimicrobiia bacterium]